MTKVVSTNNLVDAQTAACTLQLLLRNNVEKSKVDNLFQYNCATRQITILNLLGLFEDTIPIGLSFLKSKELTIKDGLDLLADIGVAYVRTHNFTKYLELCKKHQSILNNFLSQYPSIAVHYDRIKSIQITCFACLQNFSKALKESDALLKRK